MYNTLGYTMIEYDLYEYDGDLFIVPCYSPFVPGDCIAIDNVPGKYIVVRYEMDNNWKHIDGSDEIVFVADKYSECKAEFNKLRATRKDKRINYYIPELRAGWRKN